ncbi:biotin/lipoyl-binding protein [Marinilabiliaceae bacterium ANBcel2]|nr:biotin/lipoyl-binding protein [Marinilabiliaceae bacterium ANBcel2]
MKKFEFTINGNKYQVSIKDIEDNIAQIEVNGTPYDVEIHREVKKTKTPKLVRSQVKKKPGEGEMPKTGSAGIQVKAPLPGSIIKINVNVGDTVNKGDTLLIMDAMKMENAIQAEKAGTVKSIKVKAGDNVMQDAVLIELE